MRATWCLALLLVSTLVRAADDAAPKAYNPCLAAGVKQTVVFLGKAIAPSRPGDPAAAPSFFGTGFLIEVDHVFYLVTAKHVAERLSPESGKIEDVVAGLNLKNGQGVLQSISQTQIRLKVNWIFHPTADVAALPFSLSPEYNVRTIPIERFAPEDAYSELQDVFFVSFQPSLQGSDHITPILRRGMISLISGDKVYLDAFVFPGNSGSPVFSRPSAMTFVPNGVFAGDAYGCMLLGVVGSYLPYRDEAISRQTQQVRIVFEENTGLAEIVPMSALRTLISSTDFQVQHKRLLNPVADKK